MADQYRKLIKRRAGYRGDLTSLLKVIDECLGKSLDPSRQVEKDLADFRVVLQDKFEKLKFNDDEIYEAMVNDDNSTESDLVKECNGTTEIAIRVQAKISAIDAVLRKASAAFVDTENGSEVLSRGSTISGNSNKVKLPKIELQRFSGDPQKWQQFWDTFESLIHKNEDLSDIDKFNYLRSVVSGEAMSAIEGFSPTKENYKHVIDLLIGRFGKKAFIISSHMESILKLPELTGSDSIRKLRHTYDKLETHIRSLQSLGIDSKQFGPLLVPVLLDRLPPDLALIVSREFDADGDIWQLDNLLTSLKKEIEARERSGHVSIHTKSNKEINPRVQVRDRPKFTGHALFSSEQTRSERVQAVCVYCQLNHRPENCRVVTNVAARREHIQKASKCFNCLRPGHIAKQCKSNERCVKCNGKHNTSICLKQANQNKLQKPDEHAIASKKTSQTEAGSLSMMCSAATSVLMQTGRARVCSGAGYACKNVRIVFDSGSQRSFITNELKSALDLQSLGKRSLRISRFMDDESSPSPVFQDCDLVQFCVKGLDGSDIFVSACSVPQICPPLNSQLVNFCKGQFSHLADLELADESIVKPFRGDCIDVLIGLDYYWAFILGSARRGESGPVALESRIGWILSGPMVSSKMADESPSQTMFIVSSEQDSKLDGLVEKFWSLESVGIVDPDDNSVMQRFADTIKFNQTTGRYQVSLPWRENIGILADNYTQCYRRLVNQLKRFCRDPKLYEMYSAVMKDHVDAGILEPVGVESPAIGQSYYLPHHGVLRDDHETTKLRVVYDGSSSVVGPSLNQMLYEGPCLLPELVKILMRFRCRKYAFVADVQQAFLQVEVAEADRDYLRTLWVKNFDPTQSYDVNPSFELHELRFTRCVFGVTSSPFHLMATFRHHLSKYSDDSLDVVQEILKSMYVDDMVSGADSVKEACHLYLEARRMLREGGFNLRKFATNSKQLNTLVSTSIGNNEFSGDTSTTMSYSEVTQPSIERPQGGLESKVLGVLWSREDDKLVFRFNTFLAIAKTIPFTRRGLLQLIARLYDPLGLLSPILVPLKCAFQKACKENIAWDCQLPQEISDVVRFWLRDLSRVDTIEFPRYCFSFDKSSLKSVHLIGFSDASEAAFAGVFYVRVESDSGVSVNLFASRSRVAPMKPQSVPRLELLGCLVLANLSEHVKSSIVSVTTLSSEHFFTDSYTALCWVRNKGQHFKQFVEERSKKIRALTATEHWQHVKGKDNPADLATRGLLPSELKASVFWNVGPEWLRLPPDQWPVGSEPVKQTEESVKEIRKKEVRSDDMTQSLSVTAVFVDLTFERFGNWSKLKRVAAFVKRFVFNLRTQLLRRTGELTAEELADAENWLFKEAQLSFTGSINYPSLKRQLRILADENNVLRCEGRLKNAELDYDRKYPILLPARHHISRLIVFDAHERVLHSGVNDTMNFVRSRFWIPQLRKLARQIINKCVICKWVDGKSYSAKPFPSLPKFRVSPGSPFETAGVDFAGPLYIKSTAAHKETIKSYVFLSTCMWSRAVHLELVPDIGSLACVRALRRFFARRGVPSVIFSDNAKVFKSKETRAFLNDRGIKWQFTTPKAPWTGGVWERMVRITKRCLRKVLRNTSLTYEELETVLAEVEVTVNNRPLTYMDVDSLDHVLTPSHLLHGRVLPVVSPSTVNSDVSATGNMFRSRMLYRQKILRDLCCRWKREYLSSLRESNRGKKGSPSIRQPTVGDVVLVEDSVPRLSWQLGRIETLFPGADGICRSALVRLGRTQNLVKRAITCLYPLEVSESKSESLSEGLSGRSRDDLPRAKVVPIDAQEQVCDAKDDADDQLRVAMEQAECDEMPSRRSQAIPSRPSRAAARDSDFKRRYLRHT